MKFVEPIRDKNTVNAMADYIRNNYGDKYFIMFEIGIHTGLRISDILKLRVIQVSGKDEITITETKTQHTKKTNKSKLVVFNARLKSELAEYIKDLPSYYHLIYNQRNPTKGISRAYAYRVIHESGLAFGLEHCGTHTMRKTFGFHYYSQHKDIAFLMKLFNHSDQTKTLRYIGIENDDFRRALSKSLYD